MTKNYRNRCVLRMSQLPHELLGPEAARIQNALEITFPSIAPSPSEVKAVLQDFIINQQECSARNFKCVPARDKAREELLAMLQIQCDGVNYIAQGDEAILQQSGFKLLRAPESASIPAAGVIKKVTTGTSLGSFTITCKGERNHKFYEFQTIGEDGEIRFHSNRRATITIEGYRPGERIEIRSRVVNAAGEGFWSAPYVYWVSMQASQPKASHNESNDMKVA